MGRNIAIMGGTFNPIHIGHAIIAERIAERDEVDQLWLMVSPLNPLKQPQNAVNDTDRLRMTEMVASRIPKVTTSAFEFTLPRPSYTIDTLRALQTKFPDDEFTLVIGADNWCLWEQWKDHDTILREFGVMVYPRLGYDITPPPEGTARRFTVVDAPIIEISSTMIRERLAQGLDTTFLVPDEVEHFIKQHNLYK